MDQPTRPPEGAGGASGAPGAEETGEAVGSAPEGGEGGGSAPPEAGSPADAHSSDAAGASASASPPDAAPPPKAASAATSPEPGGAAARAAAPNSGRQARERMQRMVQASPPAPKRSFFGGLPMVILILGILSIASCHYTMGKFTTRLGGGQAAETLRQPGLAVIAVTGEIVDTQWAIEAVERFQADNNVKALVIRVDSPGGLVAPCQELYNALRAFPKPKIVSMGSLAASGGYYIAVTGDVIYANPGTITGSIGVIMEAIEFSSAMEKLGVKSEVIKSGAFKDSGSPFRAMRADERDTLQHMVMNVYEQFVRDVMGGRRKMTEPAVRALADGRVFSGEDAQALGLVDSIGGFKDAMAHAKRLGGLPLDKESPVLYEDGEVGFFSQLFGASVLDALRPAARAVQPGLTMKFIYHPGL